MSRNAMVRLVGVCSLALVASLVLQLLMQADFQGYPFLVFGIAVGFIFLVRLWTLVHKPVEKPA